MAYDPDQFDDNFIIIDGSDYKDPTLRDGFEYAVFGVESESEIHDRDGSYQRPDEKIPHFWEVGYLLWNIEEQGTIDTLEILRGNDRMDVRKASITDLESISRYAEDNDIPVREFSHIE